MDDLIAEQLVKKFAGTNQPAQVPVVGGTQDVQGTAGDVSTTTMASPQVSRAGSFIDRNQKDVPLDMETGLSPALRYSLGMRTDPEDKKAYLESVFGVGSVRNADTGEMIVRAADPDTKKPKDFLVDVRGPEAGDLGEAAATWPELAATIATMMATRGFPGGRIKDVIAGTLGAFVGGSGKDIAMSSKSPSEVFLDRGKQIPIDATMNALFEAGTLGLSRIATPYPGIRGAATEELKQGTKHFSDRFNIDYPLTSGEITGSPILLRTEATMSKLPGSSKEISDVREAKADALRKIMNRMMGLAEDASPYAMPGTEAVGERAVNLIKSEVSPLIRATETASSKLAQVSEREIMDELAGAVGPVRRIYPEKVGSSIRSAAVRIRDAFKKDVADKYEAAYALPGGADRSLMVPSLPGRAEKMLKSLPTKDVITSVDSPLVDQFGVQLPSKTVKGEEVMRPFVPPNVVSKLEEMASLDAAHQFSLRDLVAMRNEVSNDIAQGEALPGVQTHHLSKIRDMLTESINEATAKLPDGKLKQAWDLANDTYKNNVGKFHEGPIARLFKDIESRGFIQDEDIVRNIGPTEYATFKKFLGPNSQEFTSLKRAIVDQLVEGSKDPGGTIRGDVFAARLRDFFTKNRSVAEDTLGVSQARLMSIAKVLDAAGTSGPIAGVAGKISEQDLTRILTDPSVRFTSAIRDAVEAQAKLDKAYKSTIVRDIGNLKLGEAFDSGEFIDRFYSTASPKEIDQVMRMLDKNPAVQEDVRRKIVEKILHDAQRATDDLDRSGLGGVSPFRTSSTRKLNEIFSTEDKRVGLRNILGNDTYNDFVNLVKVLKGSESTEAAFRGAGGLQAGMQVSRMLNTFSKGGVLAYTWEWLQQKIAAKMLTSRALRGWVENQKFTPATQAEVARALISFEPFSKFLIEEFGERGAAMAMDNINQSISIWEEKNKQTTSPSAAESDATAKQVIGKMLGTNQAPAQPK